MADSGIETAHRSCYYIPLSDNARFTGRTAILNTLEDKLFHQQQPCQRTALVGLGGAGKTQVALHFAYHVKDTRPEYSIFWLPILSDGSVAQAYVEIAEKIGLQKSSADEDIKLLVCQHLNSGKAGKWLLVVDNADDQDLVFGSDDTSGFDEFLPKHEDGLILLTTRSRQIAEEFAQSDIIDVEQMDKEEAARFLKKSLSRKQAFQNEEIVAELLSHLTYLPLAIAQAAAYLNQTNMPMQKYLALLRGSEKEAVKVLGREFKDSTRYRSSRNAIATTWLVTFDQIQKSDETAVDLLSFMSCIEPKAIPQSILPGQESEELEWAIGMLCGYSFLTRRGESDTFDMHSLVHMAMRGWIEKQSRQEEIIKDAIGHLDDVFPSYNRANRELWREYTPHALRALARTDGDQTVQRAGLYMNVGLCLSEDRRFKEAITCLKQTYLYRKAYLVQEDESRLRLEHELARAYLSDRRIKDAIKMLEHVVAVEKTILDEKDESRLVSELLLARAYHADRRTKEATKILEHIVAVREETLDEEDYERLASEHALASAYVSDRRVKDGIEILEHIVAVGKATLDEEDHDRLASEHELARAYLTDLRIKDGIKILEHVVAVEKTTLDEEDYERLVSEHELAKAYVSDRRIKDGIKILEHVVAVRNKTLEEEDYERLKSEYELAGAYLSDRRIKDAIKIFEHVVAVEKTTLDENDHERLSSEHSLAKAYLDNGHVQKAIDLLEHVVAIERELFEEDDPNRHASFDLLAKAYQQLESEWETSEANSDGQE